MSKRRKFEEKYVIDFVYHERCFHDRIPTNYTIKKIKGYWMHEDSYHGSGWDAFFEMTENGIGESTVYYPLFDTEKEAKGAAENYIRKKYTDFKICCEQVEAAFNKDIINVNS